MVLHWYTKEDDCYILKHGITDPRTDLYSYCVSTEEDSVSSIADKKNLQTTDA